MVKYQAYAEYKDSGIEWLGEIPSGWFISSIKYLCYVNDGNHGEEYPKESDYTSEDEGVAFIRGGNILNYAITNKDMLYITKRKNESMRKGRLQAGDILFVNRGDIGKLALIDKKHEGSNLNSQIAYLRCLDEKINNKYLLYFLASDYINNLLLSMKMGSVLTQFPIGNLLEIKVPLASHGEQKKIANFLDHETAKIDHLIEKQQQLIELLKEKHQAVISHAVTKGLDPNVPMKNSGVEWLGEVPEHWISSRLKYYTNQIVDGAHFTPTYSESGVPFLRVTDIHNSKIDMDNIKYIPEHEHLDLIQRCKPEKGDLLLSKNGTIGIPKLVDWDWEFSIFVSICLIKFKKNLKAEFAEYFFKSYEIQEQIFGLIKKSTVINLHLDKIENFWFSIPPLDEQIQIVEYLDNKINELNNLISKAESAIQLMQERRTALISAAVTGKIDVRNWQAPTLAEADTELSA